LASNLAPYQVQESDDGSPRYHVEHLWDDIWGEGVDHFQF
jgi:hypothetical protein